MTTTAPRVRFHPRSPDSLKDPHAFLQEHIRETRVSFTDTLDAYCVPSYEWAKHVLTNDALFSSRVDQVMPVREQLYGPIPADWRHSGQLIKGRQTINMDARHHTYHHRALQQQLAHQRVRDVEPDLAANADELAQELEFLPSTAVRALPSHHATWDV